MKKTLLALVIASITMSASALDLEGADKYKSYEELGIMQPVSGIVVPDDKQVTAKNAIFGVPYNRYAYQHMREFFASTDVAPAKQAIELERAIDNSVENIKVNNADGEARTFDQFMDETWGDSIIVVHGGKVVYENYRNGMTKDQPHQMMSVTKSFGGLAAMMAVEEGKINPNDKVSKYVPELAEDRAFGGATVQQVMDMTNSMNYNEDYADPEADVARYGAVLGWLPKQEGKSYPNNMYGFLQDIKLEKGLEHGEIFHYQTPKTDALNWVTGNATGATFADFVQDDLWAKLGTTGDTYVLVDPVGLAVAGGGLNASPDNLAKFAAMMLNDGQFNGEQVVPKAVIDQLAAGGSTEAFGKGPDASNNMPAGEWSYRGQWWVSHEEGAEAFMAIGIHGQWIYIDVERDVAIVKQSSQPKSVTPAQERYDLNGLRALVNHFAK
ncbi:serine hydrolase [Shewanella sp. WXL01]|uniref:serine hydrolase domain-containing protein n=1 Tax=Shewanella sp. WXL01 TaxID=2709721 RepID=UPI0014386431|nr:serine hydrolase [Shewanella sp. WXL01]NKF49007.1 serine hydrolase [Shewanella sp. WXL01]